MKIVQLAAVLLAAIPTAASAATIEFVVEDKVLATSAGDQTDFLEVYARVQTEEGEVPPEVIGQAVRLQLVESNQGVSFTNVEMTKTPEHQYLFSGAGGFSGAVKGTYDEIADCGEFLLSGSSTLEDGAGLMRVSFEVAGGTKGTFHLSVVQAEAYTYLTDDSFANLPYGVQNGTITIVPEPSALILLLGLLPAMWLLRRRSVTRLS